jgi:IMP dehydrogenase
MKVYSKTELNSFNQSLTYDDISLIPTQVSRIKSRTEASTSCSFLGLKLNVPVISSPMDSVTGIEMAKELTSAGSLGIVNRFDSSLDSVINAKNGKGIKAVSIALNTDLKTIEKIAAKK